MSSEPVFGSSIDVKKMVYPWGRNCLKLRRCPSLDCALHGGAMTTTDLKNCVKPEKYSGLSSSNSWIGSCVHSIYGATRTLYKEFHGCCTKETCPTMRAGSAFAYRWRDSTETEAVDVSAPMYMAKLWKWIESVQDILEDTESDEFLPLAQKVISRLFRVYAHLYVHHLYSVMELNQEAELERYFALLYFFTTEFKLMVAEDMAPLQSRIVLLNTKLNTETG